MLKNAENIALRNLQILYYSMPGKIQVPHLGRKWCIFPCVLQINTKFVGLYFPHFSTFRNQTNFNISDLNDLRLSSSYFLSKTIFIVVDILLTAL